LQFWVERGACVNVSLFVLMRAWFSYKQYCNWEVKLHEKSKYFYLDSKISTEKE
jgi:hypothetical protein